MSSMATTHGYTVVMSAPRSVRFEDQVLSRLDSYVREHPGTSSSSVTNMFVDESLRAYEHPGVVFRDGPTGRRAALADGPDVWEVVAALNEIRDETPVRKGPSLVEELTEVTGLRDDQIRAVLRYYAAFPVEVDERVAANHRVAEREERLWVAQQNLLKRRPA